MSWLTADTIELAVERCADNDEVRRAFRGVYPHNRLPMLLPNGDDHHLPLTLIVNTDSHNLPGRHWTSVFIDKQRHGELFDSLATPPSGHLARFMSRHSRRWITNSLIYQHPLSSYCGVYVLLHVLQRYNCDSLETFCTTYFTSSLVRNEIGVRSYYRNHVYPKLV